MEKDTQCFWYIMLYYFKKGKNAAEAQKQNSAVCGEVMQVIEPVESGLGSFLVLLTTLTKQFFAVGLSYALEGV